MKNRNAPQNQTTRRILPMVYATALVLAFTVSLAQSAFGHQVPPQSQHSRDTSVVCGHVVAPSSDPDFVMPGTVPWLLAQDVPSCDDAPTAAPSSDV